MLGESNIIMSSRVRLARNICSYPFPNKMSEVQQKEVIELCKDAILNNNKLIDVEMKFFDISEIDEIRAKNLVENRLISQNLLNDKRRSAVIISADRKISIMINEEDHLRIQSIFPNFDIESCFKLANIIDDICEKKLDFGFDEQFGYLTCCPTNVGTAMRISVMVHLPALVVTNLIDKLVMSLSKLGMVIRGAYGEGSRPVGNIFQISNQVTLGMSEKETVEKLEQVIYEVVEQEQRAQNIFYKSSENKLEDSIMRSLGILCYARRLTADEFLILFSNIRLGINLDVIKKINSKTIDELSNEILTSEITIKYNITEIEKINEKRADIVRMTLKRFNV